MRVRPLTLFTATAAVTLLIAAGSEALVQAKVYHLPSPRRCGCSPSRRPRSRPP